MLYTEQECQKIYEQGFLDCWHMNKLDADDVVCGKIKFPVFPKHDSSILCAKNTEQQVQPDGADKPLAG